MFLPLSHIHAVMRVLGFVLQPSANAPVEPRRIALPLIQFGDALGSSIRILLLCLFSLLPIALAAHALLALAHCRPLRNRRQIGKLHTSTDTPQSRNDDSIMVRRRRRLGLLHPCLINLPALRSPFDQVLHVW